MNLHRLPGGVRSVIAFSAFVVLLMAGYTAYKALGQSIDDAQTAWPVVGSILPRTDDLTMPAVLDVLAEIFAEPRGLDEAFGSIVLGEAVFTLREAAVGFTFGVVVGLGIAIVLASSQLLEQALVPHVIASQTIPLIAIAPIVVIWGRTSLDFLPWEWNDWMSVSIIATYLTFFPVAINGLRGLHSPSPEAVELMASYAARRRQTLWRLRLPASLPYLFSAFKIAATASVVGAIVGEISAGVNGGLGRRILLEAQRYITGPERLYVAVLFAAGLGVFVYLTILLIERQVVRRKGTELAL